MNTSLRKTGSWIFYDFANTIFSAVVLTAFFPLYITQKTQSNWPLGVASTASMILAGLAVPLLGILSDATGKTKRYLVMATLITCFSMAALSMFVHPAFLIFIFLIAAFFYHASLVFYNSLLPVVSEPSNQGWISGLGTGLGYLGVVISVPIAHAVSESFGMRWVFSATACLFFLFSLPLFFWVPERTVENPVSFRWSLFGSQWHKLISLLKTLPSQPHVLLFFGGHFFIADALNSMIIWFMVYAREIFNPGQNALMALLIQVNLAAFGFGLFAGWITDRIGSLQTLVLCSISLIICTILLMAAPDFQTFKLSTLIFGTFAIAGIWTSGRKVVIGFAPQELVGEYFGIYGLTTKLSVIGSLSFSLLADIQGFRQALWVLLFPAAAGCAMLLGSKSLDRR